MTEAHIKEELSKLFISTLAAYKGIAASKPERDYGVDLRLELVQRYKAEGKYRYTQIGQAVDLQLKATSVTREETPEGFVKFDLPVNNYNDMILRRDGLDELLGGHTPLLLIIVFLPEKKSDWVNLDWEGICLKGNALWFYPDKNMEKSRNLSTQRINIPLFNEVNLEFFDNVFNLNF